MDFRDLPVASSLPAGVVSLLQSLGRMRRQATMPPRPRRSARGSGVPLLVVVASLALVACNDAPPAARSPASQPPTGQAGDSAAWRVGLSGYGPLTYGMSRVDALAAARVIPAPAAATNECRYVRLPGAGQGGVLVMMVGDSAVRVDVDSVGVATLAGDRVGDTEAAVLARHDRRARVSPHHYTGPAGHYVTVMDPADTTRQLVFETDGQRVTRYRAGLRPYVEWVEGCS